MVTSLNRLAGIREQHRNRRIVLALGTFDIIHPAHIAYLNAAKEHGDLLVVTLKSDEQVRAHKGVARPVVSESNRVFVVANLKPVDYALVGAEGDLYAAALNTAKALKPDVVALGPDWGPSVMPDWQRDLPNTEIVIAYHTVEGSTTAIIQNIKIDSF